jgi:putative exporter of polyketide antibiotics
MVSILVSLLPRVTALVTLLLMVSILVSLLPRVTALVTLLIMVSILVTFLPRITTLVTLADWEISIEYKYVGVKNNDLNEVQKNPNSFASSFKQLFRYFPFKIINH